MLEQAEFQILYNEGISRESEIIDLGVKHGLVDKAGAWYSVGSERIGQGKDNARDYLKDHPKMNTDLEEKIKQKILTPEEKYLHCKEFETQLV
jgi:recombination protein RecA